MRLLLCLCLGLLIGLTGCVQSLEWPAFIPGKLYATVQGNVCTANLYLKPSEYVFVGQETSAWVEVFASPTNSNGLWTVQASGTFTFGTDPNPSNVRWNQKQPVWWFSWTGFPAASDEYALDTGFSAVVQCTSNQQGAGEDLRLNHSIHVLTDQTVSN